jgi:hypothetical protein
VVKNPLLGIFKRGFRPLRQAAWGAAPRPCRLLKKAGENFILLAAVQPGLLMLAGILWGGRLAGIWQSMPNHGLPGACKGGVFT